MEEGKAGARELEKTKGSSSQLIQHLEAVEAEVALKAVGRDVYTCVEYQAVEIETSPVEESSCLRSRNLLWQDPYYWWQTLPAWPKAPPLVLEGAQVVSGSGLGS